MTASKVVKTIDNAELRAAAERLGAAFSEAEVDEIVAEFKQLRRAEKKAASESCS